MTSVGGSSNSQALPVIVLTGSNEQAVFGTAMALDCNAFVRKAESSDAIRDRMARVLTEPLEIDKTAVYHAVKIPDITINAPPADPPQEDTPPSAEAYQVSIEDVPTGALVARNVTTVDGSMLLAAGSVLSGANLNRLKDLSEIVELSSIWVET